CIIALTLLITAFSATAVSCAGSGSQLKKDAAAKMARGFSCTAKISWESNNYEVKITRPADGGCTLTFVSPSELNSLCFSAGSSGAKITFGGLGISVDTSSLPQYAMYKAFSACFDSCLSPDSLSTVQRGGNTGITGKNALGRFTLTFDANLNPVMLEISGANLTAHFYNFQYNQP
ncbi:MAG TPA: hypothetical protein VHR42_08790, partial [Clostridia bacterium]|nr:hypothetical protein [Clostridia bacterium]